MEPREFFSRLWNDYIEITPQAKVIKRLFEKSDDRVINDHVAFRTFAGTPISLEYLEPLILSMGYQRQESYAFKAKKLRAFSFIHSQPELPKIFCSELLTEQLSQKAQGIISTYTQQIKAEPEDLSMFWSGRHWEMPSWQDYSELMAESEYGAWLLALGIRANHFTISVNHLSSTDSLQEVLNRVKAADFAINSVGGEIKGNPGILLEQAATMADRKTFVFAEGEAHEIPTCFYEFALRYPNAKGELYQGFVEANADKIFESTHAEQ